MLPLQWNHPKPILKLDHIYWMHTTSHDLSGHETLDWIYKKISPKSNLKKMFFENEIMKKGY